MWTNSVGKEFHQIQNICASVKFITVYNCFVFGRVTYLYIVKFYLCKIGTTLINTNHSLKYVQINIDISNKRYLEYPAYVEVFRRSRSYSNNNLRQFQFQIYVNCFLSLIDIKQFLKLLICYRRLQVWFTNTIFVIIIEIFKRGLKIHSKKFNGWEHFEYSVKSIIPFLIIMKQRIIRLPLVNCPQP